MMYGADQERAQAQQQVAPYPTKGYHIEIGGGRGASNSPVRNKLAGTPAASGGSREAQLRMSTGYPIIGGNNNTGRQRQVSINEPTNVPLSHLFIPPGSSSLLSGQQFGGNKVYDPNVTAAASVALARANAAQTMASGTPTTLL